MRASGILMPISSLPSAYGIGCFSKEAYEFAEACGKAGQTYWQILPLGPTGYGDSPYQSFSTFAGNPYFIDLEELIESGLLTKQECDSVDFGSDPEDIDYEKLYAGRKELLQLAYRRSNIAGDKAFLKFVKKNAYWLDDYALYMAVKNHFGDVCWAEWDEDIRLRDKKAMLRYRELLADEIRFYQFQQYLFFTQWEKLKTYANARGVKIVGDIPIYVAYDSADAWANPKLFQFDRDCRPIKVAGCPPDAFAKTGQLWGNPLYDWPKHKKTGYAWWMKRMTMCFELYDVVRIDHFRGFDSYYAIPAGDTTAEFGSWEPGPGAELFKTMREKLGEKAVIAEDLGFLTESVIEMVKESGFPSMKVLQFAFDSDAQNAYLPHHYHKNCVVYTGTHDNDTVVGWYQGLNRKTKKHVKQYLNLTRANDQTLTRAMIRCAMASVADMCIVPMQDYLCLGSQARINTPSTLGGNWCWRMQKGAFTEELIGEIRDLTALYARAPVGDGKKES